MNYATQTREHGLCFTHITPLDPHIVVLNASVIIPSRKHNFTETDFDLFEALALTGTNVHTKEDIDTFMKRHGISLSVTSDRGRIHYALTVEQINLTYAVSLLTEIICTLKITREEFRIKQATLLEENREEHDNAKRIAEINFRRLLYPKQSLFHERTLAEERIDIEAASLKAVNELSRELAEGAWYISLVGDATAKKTLEPLIHALQKKSEFVIEDFPQPHVKPVTSTYVTVPGKTNVEIRIGNILPIMPTDDDFFAFQFGLAVLGKIGSFSGRLMSIVREKEGLTYGIYANVIYHDMLHYGHWLIYTFFTAHDLKKGIDATIREITTIVEKGITEKELSIFKEILKNLHTIARGSNARRMSVYHSNALFGKTPDEVENDLERLMQLTRHDVNTALKKYINPSALVISGAGPVTNKGIGIQKKE